MLLSSNGPKHQARSQKFLLASLSWSLQLPCSTFTTYSAKTTPLWESALVSALPNQDTLRNDKRRCGCQRWQEQSERSPLYSSASIRTLHPRTRHLLSRIQMSWLLLRYHQIAGAFRPHFGLQIVKSFEQLRLSFDSGLLLCFFLRREEPFPDLWIQSLLRTTSLVSDYSCLSSICNFFFPVNCRNAALCTACTCRRLVFIFAMTLKVLLSPAYNHALAQYILPFCNFGQCVWILVHGSVFSIAVQCHNILTPLSKHFCLGHRLSDLCILLHKCNSPKTQFVPEQWLRQAWRTRQTFQLVIHTRQNEKIVIHRVLSVHVV